MAHTIETAYITVADLTALLPAAFLTEALDDDGDGVMDADEAVLIAASNEVDGYLENRYLVPVPRAATPALVMAAVVHIAVEMCYLRRGLADKNPYKDKVKVLRSRLESIRNGGEDLDLTTRIPADAAPIQVLTIPAVAVTGRNAVAF